ncbi:MAG: DUF4296 domain-containing protein [Chitinophagales bacterium]
MFNLLQKYSSKLVFFTLTVIFISACVQKPKYDKHKKLLPDTKMIRILQDVLIMESYVYEKLPSAGIDTLNAVKNQFYKEILNKYNVDSTSFYSTLYYLQMHPEEFDSLLSKVDDKLMVMKPKDTTHVKVIAPSGLPQGNVIDEEKRMRDEYEKHFPGLLKNRNKDSL